MKNPDTVHRANLLRKSMTFPERLLWSRLRLARRIGLVFRRQHPIGPFIADFCCPRIKLVLELDGRSHEGREERDESRTGFLERNGYTVIRFSNDEVIGDLEGVLRKIEGASGIRD